MISEQSQAHKTHTSMWTNAWSERANSPPTLLFIPFHVPPHWQSIWDKSLPPYSSMLVVPTYPKSTYVFDYLQHLFTRLFLTSTTPLSMFYHNLQQIHIIDLMDLSCLLVSWKYYCPLWLKMTRSSMWWWHGMHVLLLVGCYF